MATRNQTAGLTALVCSLAFAAEVNPVTRVWRVNPQPGPAALEVHSVRVDERFVHVESAGLALQSLAPLDVNAVDIAAGLRKFDFIFPLIPKKGNNTPTPWGVTGAFVNGVPLYSVTSSVSWRDQNLWHQDAIAANPGRSALVAAMLETRGKHSPLIGFALDGYPIYGPWGYEGRLRSGYRLRAITRRDRLPDGTELGPSQEGPPVSPQYPAGTFVEDYEYVAGSSDLDEHNGRIAKTPEYPGGTYAYFLSTDAQDKLTYPYLLGSTYYGEVSRAPDLPERLPLDGDPSIRMAVSGDRLVFSLRDVHGRRIRFPERTHEKPIHLVVVSADLKNFAHIHPELQPDDTFLVHHQFGKAGRYWLYADYTMPGKAQSISRFQLDVKSGAPEPSKVPNEVKVRARLPARMRTGEDFAFRFDMPVNDLEPYLGAWAHIMIISEDGRHFIHAHPVEEGSVPDDPWKHSHTAPGPSPSSISTITGFTTPGRYRMWLQFQRAGKVTAIPFDLNVTAGKSRRAVDVVPPDSILVKVSRTGFEPSRISIASGKPRLIAFQREDAENCASSVVFPDLNVRKDLPAGRTTLVELPAMKTGELTFSCGMKMYRGAVIVR